ncbi:DUF981 domain-containing protein [Leucobacter allii]|uniref:DUF981 family protein n=1 Tax=Leucobacter allii TaxID=2932247 RepID=UPI001FD07593|nr:DUF981 family protein [Leucobacter allii]UOR01193.1 DUF981 domain-containing protein [Leucobacter allii]
MDDFFTGGGGDLVIDWTSMPTYNTIMSIAAGAGLLLLVSLGRSLHRDERFRSEGWALGAGVLGVLLTLTGAHMTLTWPFAKYFPFDNIIFGETSLGLGVLLLAAAFYLWKRAAVLADAEDRAEEVAATAKPLSVFVFGLGLALFGIAAAGIVFQLFAAPAEEPVSGAFAQWPWLEASFMSGLFALVGLGAVLFPFALRSFSSTRPLSGAAKTMGVVWAIAGVAFLLFGALNFYTHIGLIVNTMG